MIQLVDNPDQMVAFLRKHEDTTLFLLNNFFEHGLRLTDAPNSGNYYIATENDQVVAVFVLCRRGTILVESERENYSDILETLRREEIPITGVIGRWDFVSELWKHLALRKTMHSKEILYAVDLAHVPQMVEPVGQFLTEEDLTAWNDLTCRFNEEEELPMLSEEHRRQEFLRKASKKIIWGRFEEGRLVAMADLNAVAFDVGQLGGVYTLPEYRNRGYCRALNQKVFNDLSLRKLIIFTGHENSPAQKVYESLGAQRIGFYGLLFGN